MAYITPNTDIKILSGVPLNNDYQNTVYFEDRTTQVSAFAPYVKYTLGAYSYQRSSKNTIRIGKAVEDLYDCNYMMFRNTSFGSKWFYAFITDVEYINNNTSQITFEIDVMQTWLSGENLDYEILPSFIERNHTITDIVGENTVYENVNLGTDYFPSNYEYIKIRDPRLRHLNVIFYTTFSYKPNETDKFPDFVPTVKEDVLTGLNTIVFELTDSSLNTFLTQVVSANKLSGIISVFVVPYDFEVDDESRLRTVYFTKRNLPSDTINGYIPKNRKLYTHPYNMLHAITSNSCVDYKYELFKNSRCTFTVYDSMLPSPSTTLVPFKYTDATRTDLRVSENRFPQCSFNADVFKEYLASHLAQIGYGILNDVGLSAIGIATGRPIAAIAPFIDITNKIGKMFDLSTQPPHLNGTQASTADWISESIEIKMCQYTIKAEYAKIIDDYFTKYGYAINSVDVPILNAREHWTFVKTLGINIKGKLPQSDTLKISSIFNNGVTFWNDIDEVGDYTLDNTTHYIPPSPDEYEPRLDAPYTSLNAYYRHTTVNDGLNECLKIDDTSGAVMPNCVGYTWGRWYEILNTKPKLSKGDAGEWFDYSDTYSRRQPYETPALGDIACFYSSQSVGGGHVSVVEQKNSDTEFVTSNSYYGSTFFTLEYLRWDSNSQTWKRYNYLSGSEITGYTLQGFIVNPINE